MDRQLYKEKLELMDKIGNVPFAFSDVRDLFPYLGMTSVADLFDVQKLENHSSERLVALPPLYDSGVVHYIRAGAYPISEENPAGVKISYEGATQHFNGILYTPEALKYACDNWGQMMDLYTGQLLVEIDLFGSSQKLEEIARTSPKLNAFERVKVFSKHNLMLGFAVYAMYVLLDERKETLQQEKNMGAPIILPRDDVLWTELIAGMPHIRMAACDAGTELAKKFVAV